MVAKTSPPNAVMVPAKPALRPVMFWVQATEGLLGAGPSEDSVQLPVEPSCVHSYCRRSLLLVCAVVVSIEFESSTIVEAINSMVAMVAQNFTVFLFSIFFTKEKNFNVWKQFLWGLKAGKAFNPARTTSFLVGNVVYNNCAVMKSIKRLLEKYIVFNS